MSMTQAPLFDCGGLPPADDAVLNQRILEERLSIDVRQVPIDLGDSVKHVVKVDKVVRLLHRWS